MNNYLEEFFTSYLKNLIKQPTCFKKNSDNPTLIDQILTNSRKSFHSSSVYVTGSPDFHKLTLTVLKTFYVKYKLKIIQYRDFIHFGNASFRADFQELSLKNVLPGKFEKFKYTFWKALKIHAPMKEKHVRSNQSPFVSKHLREVIMTRTLLNKNKKDNSAGNLFVYKRQINFCVKLLRKSKKDFHNNLSVKRITDNRKFWQTIKPNFNNKTQR